jgi:hypothetical protein
MMPKVTGKISMINIKGSGPNSAQLEFVVGNRALVITAYPEFEPQVFTAISNLLVAAFYAGGKVTVNYRTVAGQTSRATEVEVR